MFHRDLIACLLMCLDSIGMVLATRPAVAGKRRIVCFLSVLERYWARRVMGLGLIHRPIPARTGQSCAFDAH